MQNSIRKSLILSVGAVALMSSTASFAQTENENTKEGQLMIDNIIVTAQKRTSTVQDTALSIGVVSGDEISDRILNSIDDAIENIAGVEIQGIAQGSQVYIRGVGSSIDPTFADPAIALMVDGIYNGRTESLNSGTFDIERIEVLRGPQGTLYGRNASGGAINVITKNPVHGENSGTIRVQAGNYGLTRFEGIGNLDLSDNAALRIAAYTENRDGYVDDGSSDSDSWGARAKLSYDHGDWLNVLAKLDYAEAKGHGANTVPVPGSAGNLSFPPPFFIENFDPSIQGGPPFTGGFPIFRFPDGWQTADASDPWANNAEHVAGSIDRTAITVGLEVNADLGFADLTVLSSYTKLENTLVSSFLFGSILPFQGPTFDVNSNYGTGQASVVKYKSLEARLASSHDGPLQYVAGLYYMNAAQDAPNAANEGTTEQGTAYTTTNILEPSTTLAAFGQITYSVTDQLRFNAGLRLSQDKVGQKYLYTLDGETAPTEFTIHEDKVNSTQWKLGAEYDLSSGSLLYAHASTGFKQGGLNMVVPPILFEPEKLLALEVGSKNRLFDGRMTLNVSAFHYDYENYQYSVFTSVPIGSTGQTASFPYVGNAGATTIKGAELETQLVPWENASIKGSLTYLDAKYGTAVLPNNPFVNQGDFDLGGRQIQNAPTFTASLGIEQSFDAPNGKVTFSANSNYSDGYYTTPEQYLPGAYQESFTRTNLGVRYKSDTDWSMGLWLKNLENDAQTTYVFPVYRRFISNPRTYGVNLEVNF